MNLLWLLAIPPWIFAWVALAVGYFKLSDWLAFERRWWWLPLWLALGAPGLVIMAGGIVFLVFLALGLAAHLMGG